MYVWMLCMYVLYCIHVCMYVCMYVYMYVCLWAKSVNNLLSKESSSADWWRSPTSSDWAVCLGHVYMYVCMYVCMYECVRAYLRRPGDGEGCCRWRSALSSPHIHKSQSVEIASRSKRGPDSWVGIIVFMYVCMYVCVALINSSIYRCISTYIQIYCINLMYYKPM